MKLKAIARIGLIISIFFVVASLFVNFDLVPNINSFTEQSRILVDNLSNQSNALSSSIDALDVASQSSSEFFDAFLNEQKQILSMNNSNLLNTLKQLESLLIEIDRISIGRHSILIKKMLTDISEINASSLHLGQELLVLEHETGKLNPLISSISLTSESINSSVNLLNTRIIQDMTVLLNVTVITLIGIITILLFGVFQLVNHLLPNIITSLKIINGSQILDSSIPNIHAYYNEAKTIKNEIQGIYDEKKFIVELQNRLLDVYVVEDTMNVLFEFLKPRLGIDRVGLAYVDYQNKTFVAEYGVLEKKEIILGAGFVQSFSKSSLSEILIHKQPVVNNDIHQSFVNRPQSDALKMLNQEQIGSNLTIPIIMNQIVFGFIFLSSYKKDFFNDTIVNLGKQVADEVKTHLNRAYFTNVILTKVTSAFSEIVENKDNDTGNHIVRMVKYSTLLARAIKVRNHPEYQIDEKTILEIERYAAVHDIGKVGIPDVVLKKEDKLTPEEWEIMKKHPDIGADVFKNLRVALNTFDAGLYQVAEDITRYHHERWDGLGYPKGLSGLDIPLVARIVAVADVFDALTSKRSYKTALSFDESIQIIMNASNTQLDPFIVQVFTEELEQFKNVYTKFSND
jgi:HD-GYP domain-containing protein (c-di-GMP phosphodiesterase class II)